MRRWLAAIVLAVSAAGPAAALDLPNRKPGLWQITTILGHTQSPPQVMQQCVDAATDKLLQEKYSLGEQTCPEREVSRWGGTIVVDSSCRIGDMALTMHAVFDGDFDSAYTVKITMTRGSLTMEGASMRTMTLRAKWQGPCTAYQRPGDVEMPGVMRMNVLDLSKMW